MIPYILHVTVITTICFLFYKLLLQKETFYQLNRWTLMGCLAVSFALPLLPVPRAWSWRDRWNETAAAAQLPVSVRRNVVKEIVASLPIRQDIPVSGLPSLPLSPYKQARRGAIVAAAGRRSKAFAPATPSVTEKAVGPVTAVAPVITAITVGADKSGSNNAGTPVEKNGAGTLARFFSGATLLLALQWLFYAYLFGVLVFGARFLLQLLVLLFQSYSRPVIRDGHFRIVETSGNRAPCSFGNTIFINPELYDWETYNQILIHEKIHVSGGHTLDILLAEIALVIQWFNPFAWLYRREVENNLEFLTDANVLLDQSIERSAYQLSLLRVSAPHLPFSLTNNYNQSLLKRRIVMMNSKRSAFHTVWKYFFLLPLLACLMCALNKPTIALGAVNKKMARAEKLARAHAVIFHLWAPSTDTTKRPVKASDSMATAAPAPVRSNGSSTGDGHSESAGSSSASGTSESAGSSESIGSGNAVVTGDDNADVVVYSRPSGEEYIKVKKVAKTDMVMAIPAMSKIVVEPKIGVAVRADIKVPELPRFYFGEDSLLTDGAWYAIGYGDKLSFELKAEDEDHSWSNTMHVDKNEISPFPGSGNVEFKIVREAGTMVFKGQFDGQEGFGHFHFTPDPGYIPALKQLGVEEIEDRRQFGFYALNIKKDFVAMLARNGYPHISARDLMSLAATHVDEAYIQYWRGTDLGDETAEPRTLVRLKALHIDRAYVEELKAAGYDHLNIRELESLKAQRIDKEYIHSLGRRTDNQPIPVRELVSYKALHIDSAYLQGLRKLGYDNLATREITSLYSLHVTPEYIQQLQGLGYGDLQARELASLKALGVTPDFIAGFNKLGYDHIPVRTLTSLKATGVTPEYVGKLKAQGFESKDLNKYIRLKSDFN